MDCCCGGFRVNWYEQAARQQRYPTSFYSSKKPKAYKKDLIPKDGQWLVRFSTLSPWNVLQREVKRRKFYATLPKKLDAEQEKWLKSQPSYPPASKRLEDLHIRAAWYEPKEPRKPD